MQIPIQRLTLQAIARAIDNYSPNTPKLMENKLNWSGSYDDVVKWFKLQPEASFQVLDFEGEGPFAEMITDRSMMMRNSVMMWLCQEGSAVVSIEGASHTLKAGQMLIIFAGTYYRLSAVTTDFQARILIGLITEEASVDSLVNTFPRIKHMPVISLYKQEYNTLSTFMSYVEASIENYRNPNRADIDRGLLALLRSELVDVFLKRNMTVRQLTGDEQLAKRFTMMLIVGCQEHRDVEYYAEQFGLTPKKFSSKIKRVLGKTPSDIIADAVIKISQKFLMSTTLNTLEISERLHFATPSFFCRYFKRHVGMSPQEWRSQNADADVRKRITTFVE